MVHLSNAKVIGAMVFYLILTFFLGPLVTRPFMSDRILTNVLQDFYSDLQ